MGTEIELTIAGIGLSYSKNSMGPDFGAYFQPQHRVQRHSDQINYEYFLSHPEINLAGMEAAFVCSLSELVPRLDLLGSTIEIARRQYEAIVAEEQYFIENGDEVGEINRGYLDFDEFCQFACRYPLSDLDQAHVPRKSRKQKEDIRGRFLQHEDEIARIPGALLNDQHWSEASYFGAKVCILSPDAMLLVFSLNPANADAEVVWAYGPMVDAGWVPLEAFQPCVRRGQTVLVATEGSSDARILKHALDLLRPEVADFFRFIDVNEPHPFWGTGNMTRFAEGLVRIDVQNRVIFLLDNDAEGREAYVRIKNLKLPNNMRVIMLPEIDAFRNFIARGPEGVHLSDINGRAAAIECYLDLRLSGRPPAQVLWSNYKKELETWQGALEHKETYMRHFLDQTPNSICQDSYDTERLAILLAALIREAGQLASIRAGADHPGG